jgi:heme exporter protein C
MPPKFALTFAVAFIGMTCLFVTLCKYEMASKHATFRLRALKRKLAGDDDALAVGSRSAAPQL